MKTAVQILEDARALISDESRWIKGDFYRLKPNGRCYCSVGAVDEAAGMNADEWRSALNALEYAAKSFGFGSPITLNDSASTSHRDVLRMFDTAINDLKKEAA